MLIFCTVNSLSFRAPCTCIKRVSRVSYFKASRRIKEELQNAFLDESKAQKEAKIDPFKKGKFFAIFANFGAKYCP